MRYTNKHDWYSWGEEITVRLQICAGYGEVWRETVNKCIFVFDRTKVMESDPLNLQKFLHLKRLEDKFYAKFFTIWIKFPAGDSAWEVLIICGLNLKEKKEFHIVPNWTFVHLVPQNLFTYFLLIFRQFWVVISIFYILAFPCHFCNYICGQYISWSITLRYHWK